MDRLIDTMRCRLLGVIALVGTCGCEVITGDCGEDLRAAGPQIWSEGTTEAGVYRSSSWQAAEWLDFPSGIELRLEHDLGEEPSSWSAFVAVDRAASLVQASGEEVELVSIDDEAVVVRNPSCSDLVIVVTAAAP